MTPLPRIRSGWIVVSSSFVSNLGDGVQLSVFPLLALTVSDSPLAIGGVALARVIPAVAAVAPIGVLADRYDRFALAAIANVLRAIAVVVLFASFVANAGSVGLLVVVAMMLGSCEALFETTSSAVIPEVVSRAHLQKANSLIAFGQTFANGVIGPVIGAVLFTVYQVLPLAVTGILLAASGGLLALGAPWGGVLRRESASGEQTDAVRPSHQFVAGLRAISSSRILVVLLVLSAGWNLLGWIPEGPFVIYVTREMGASSAVYSVLLASTAIGSLIGSAIAGFGGMRLRTTVLWGATPLYGTGFLAVYFLDNLTVIGAVFMAQGLPLMMWAITATTVRQRLVDVGLLGRVNAVFYGTAIALGPIGMALGSAIATIWSARATFVVAGAALLMLSVVTIGMLNAGRTRNKVKVELDHALRSTT